MATWPKKMWGGYPGVCEITSITNAQNKTYWKDTQLDNAIAKNDDKAIVSRKKEMKRALFKAVADQNGKLFNEDVITIVWSRRFAGYKRADLVMSDWQRFINMIGNTETPVQFIWAGKPYPSDYGSINLFNQIISRVKPLCQLRSAYRLRTGVVGFAEKRCRCVAE